MAVGQVREQSTAVLRDLRSLVGLLREDQEPGDTRPETLAGVAALVATAPGPAVVDLTVLTPGGDGPVGNGVGPLAQLAAYRMVQESLANAARHAPGPRCGWSSTSASRTPCWSPSATPPAGAAARPGAGAGFGLVGMRERAELTGATSRPGRTADGGWQVSLRAATRAVDGGGPMIRVLVADDQPLVRAGLSTLLGAEPDIEVVGAAADGAEAVELARELRPDVVCMDIRMPGRDGISATRALCGPDVADPVPVLVLTTFDIDDYLFGALEAGASGFLLKDAEPAVLVHAVRSVAAGNGTLDDTLTKRVLREVVDAPADPAGERRRATELLTPRELEILLLLAQGMSNDEIARALVVELSTVKSHLARMLPKLGVRSRLQAVVWAYQNHVVDLPD